MNNLFNNKYIGKFITVILLILIVAFYYPPISSKTQAKKTKTVKKNVKLSFTVSTPNVKLFKSASNNSGVIVSVGQSGIVWVTKDSKKWSIVKSGTKENLYSVTWAFNKFIAVGANGTIISSANGTKWTKINSKTKSDFYNTEYINGRLFVYISQGGFLLSENGTTYGEAATGIPSNKKVITRKIIFNVKEYIAVLNGMLKSKVYGNNPNMAYYSDISDTASYIAISKDLKTWKLNKYNVNLYSIASNGNEDVVTGDGIVMTSYDDQTWETTKLKIPYSNKYILLDSILWNGNHFTALGMTGTKKEQDNNNEIAANSIDGKNWSVTPYSDEIGITRTVEGFIWTGSEYMALSQTYTYYGGKGSSIRYSKNGKDWSAFSINNFNLSISNYNLSICYDGKKYIFTDELGLIYTMSIPDLTSTKRIAVIQNSQIKTDLSNPIIKVFFDGKQFVSLSSSILTNPTQSVFLSKDGINWTVSKSGMPSLSNTKAYVTEINNISNDNFNIIWDGKQYIISDFTDHNTDSSDNLSTSHNLLIKNQMPSENYFDITKPKKTKSNDFDIVLPSEYYFHYLSFFNNKYIATLWNSKVALSNNGLNWNIVNCSLPVSTSSRQGVAVGKKSYVMVCNDGFYYSIYYSTNGESWTKQYSIKIGPYAPDVFYFNNHYFVSIGNFILESTDGKKWAKVFTGTKNLIINNIKWLGDRFIAVGSGGTVLTSSNGVKWQTEKSPINDYFVDAAEGNGKIIVVSSIGKVIMCSK